MLAINWLQSEREVNLGGWLNIRKYQSYAHNYRNANEVANETTSGDSLWPFDRSIVLFIFL